MLGETGCQHIGQHARHDCRSKHVVEAIKSFLDQTGIYVEEEIVNILDGELEIFKTEFVGQDRCLVEPLRNNLIASYWHGWVSRAL